MTDWDTNSAGSNYQWGADYGTTVGTGTTIPQASVGYYGTVHVYPYPFGDAVGPILPIQAAPPLRLRRARRRRKAVEPVYQAGRRAIALGGFGK